VWSEASKAVAPFRWRLPLSTVLTFAPEFSSLPCDAFGSTSPNALALQRPFSACVDSVRLSVHGPRSVAVLRLPATPARAALRRLLALANRTFGPLVCLGSRRRGPGRSVCGATVSDVTDNGVGLTRPWFHWRTRQPPACASHHCGDRCWRGAYVAAGHKGEGLRGQRLPHVAGSCAPGGNLYDVHVQLTTTRPGDAFLHSKRRQHHLGHARRRKRSPPQPRTLGKGIQHIDACPRTAAGGREQPGQVLAGLSFTQAVERQFYEWQAIRPLH
jgi:hypothetical protein